MNDTYAIEITNLSKTFNLHDSHFHQAVCTLGLNRFWPFKGYKVTRTKTALSDINLKIKPGEKVGIIGSNGSGKTTLLRIIIQQINQTSGSLQVQDDIQAMMQTGYGFNDELSGHDNVLYSLYYNSLTKQQQKAALEDKS